MNQPAKLAVLDRIGGCASTFCAIHCALMPFAAGLLPAIGLGIFAGDSAEYLLMTFAIGLGLVSVAWGFRVHRSWRALPILALGIALLATGRALEEADRVGFGAIAMVSGGLAIACAHVLNLWLGRNRRGFCRIPAP